MPSTYLKLGILCCILGTLTSAAPVIQALNSRGNEAERQKQVGDKMGELQDQTESPPLKALSFQLHIDQYKQAALNMADEDVFPEHLCENGTLNGMRHVLSIIPHDGLERGLERVLVMVTFMQSEGCRNGALHTATKLMQLVNNGTSKYRHDDVTSKPAKAGQGGQTARDHCSAVDECRWRGVADVRTIMADEADLLLLYDSVAAGIFFASGRPSLAQALCQDLWDDLHAKNPKLLHPRFRRSTITEADVRLWVKHARVPYLGTVYNVTTGAYYWHKGDTEEAENRLISAGVDLAESDKIRHLSRSVHPLMEEGVEIVYRHGVREENG